MPMNAMSAQNVGQAQQQGSMANMAAMGQYGQAQQAVSPYNQAAGSAYSAGLEAANPYTYGGGQAVNAQQIGGQQIGQFMSPFLGSAYNAMLAGENMQNAQQASGLQGNSIQAGAFGGDRAGIAQANLAYQQNLANAQTNANFLNTGYNQALTAAQQQQGVNLSAQQANRAALQTTGQNLYNQYTGTGQALSNLGQNIFGQGTTVAQGIGNLGQQQYAQGMGAAAQQAALGNQAYNQYTGTGQALSNLGQNVFGQGTTVAQGIGNLGQQQYAQGMGAAAQQAALGNQAYNQYTGTGQALAGLGQNVYGQQTGAAQGLAGVGNQAFTQGATTAAQQAALGNQLYGMGTGASQQLAALGTGAQGAALQGAQAQMGAGQVAQQTQQAGLTALYNQFLQQQAYPFQTSQFYTNAVGSLGPLYGATTTSTTPMSIFGNARGGSVRSKYASGGLIPSSMGGAVGIEHAGEGFAYGGTPDVMSAIQAIYNPTGNVASGLAPSSAAWGDIFNTLGSQTAAKPSASQMLSDYSLLNPAALRAPPATSSSGTTTSSAPTTTSSIPYMSATSTGLGAGELGGMGGPDTGTKASIGTGTFMGDVMGFRSGILSGIGDIINGPQPGSSAEKQASAETQASAEKQGGESAETQGGESAGPAGPDERNSGGRVGKYYGGAASGLGLSPQQIADIQAMMQANNGLLPGMPAGYKPMTSMNAQPGQGLAGINMQAHPSQIMRGPFIQQPNNTSVVGGLTHGVNDLKALQNDYNFFAGDNSNTQSSNTQSNSSNPGLLSTIGSALGFASGGLAGRGHYANAGSVYTSAGQEAAIPDYNSDIDFNIPDVPFNPPQIQQPQTSSSKGSGGGGLGGLLNDLAGIASLFGGYKDGGSVDGRRGYGAGGGGSGNGAGGDTDIQSIVDEEAIKLGLPISLGRALIGQESSYNQNLTGNAGELGASQILPSTAKSPGYGMQGVDPSTLAGPDNARNNIKFGLSYLKARGEHAGVNDWTDTSQIPQALMAYNGGGDPNYVQHVMSRMNDGNGNVVGGNDGGGGGDGGGDTSGLGGGSISTSVPINQSQSAGLSPPNGSPYQQMQAQPLNWFQRNQDVLGGVAGAIGGMRGARNPIAAILGAVGGGAAGYNAGQQALGAQANQEAQRQKIAAEAVATPQNVAIAQQKIDIDRTETNLKMLAQIRQVMSGYIASGRKIPPEIAAKYTALLGGVGTINSYNNPPNSTPVAGVSTQQISPSNQSQQRTTSTATTQTQPPTAPAGGPQNAQGPKNGPIGVDNDLDFLAKLHPDHNPVVLDDRANQAFVLGNNELGNSLRTQAASERTNIYNTGFGTGRDMNAVAWPNIDAYKTSQANASNNPKLFADESAQSESRKKTSLQLDALQNVLEQFNSGSFQGMKSDLIGKLTDAGIDVPDKVKNDAAQFQIFTKDALQGVFAQAQQLSGGVKVGELNMLTASNPNPAMMPVANKSILAQARGYLDYGNNRYNALSAARNDPRYMVGGVFDLSKFQSTWGTKPENQITPFFSNAEKNIAVRGATPADYRDWQKGANYVIEPGEFGNKSSVPIVVKYDGVTADNDGKLRPHYTPVRQAGKGNG